MSILDDLMNGLKFFPHDIREGQCEKVGDQFTALFMGAEYIWKVTECLSGYVTASPADPEDIK